ncbi:hypothetical protein EU528_05735 [Candidatus Thorarchaeota archaeon]|nr:MAG: hypothetical protein EU528_05735 [Candidatus Thorarchaeota archaeon]
MSETLDLSQLVSRLVKIAYPELNQSCIKTTWGISSSFATISWTHDYKDVRIKCSNETKTWHEAALTGLLSHELSHLSKQNKEQSERCTDLDAIMRGFGPYLGVERLFAGKYEDHIIRKGKDRYLGYRSIRQLLNESELKHLDMLLEQLRLLPSKKNQPKLVHHDIAILHTAKDTMIKIDGHEFKVTPQRKDAEVGTILRGNTVHVIIDDEEVGHFDSPTS